MKSWFFDLFLNLSQTSKVFWHCWSILCSKLLFWISDSDSLYVTVYGNMVWKCFLIIVQKKVPEVWTMLAPRTFLRCVGIFGPKWSPYVAEASIEHMLHYAAIYLAKTLVLTRHVALTALRAVNAMWRSSLYIDKTR